MLNERHQGQQVRIKGSKFYYVILQLFIVGGLVGTIICLNKGLKFDSLYSLWYLYGGFSLFPIFLYLFFCFLPGLIPGRTLVTLIKGRDGSFETKKGRVPFTSIKEVKLLQNRLTLVERIVIKTFEGRTYKIPVYEIIQDYDFCLLIELYVYPYMSPEGKQWWDGWVNLKWMKEVGKYERPAG